MRLHLEEQLVFRRLPHFSVQEIHFDAIFEQFFQEQHLVRVVASQTIRTMDIQPIDPSSRCRISQSFERRANERGSAVAIIKKFQGGEKGPDRVP
jgi:N-acetyl-gamma-glutamylphosphate reductase